MLVRENPDMGGGLVPVMAGEDQVPKNKFECKATKNLSVIAILLTFISIKYLDFICPSMRNSTRGHAAFDE